MAWKRSRARISPGPPKQIPIKHRLTKMLAGLHVAEEVTRSPFGVQTRRNLDSSQRIRRHGREDQRLATRIFRGWLTQVADVYVVPLFLEIFRDQPAMTMMRLVFTAQQAT